MTAETLTLPTPDGDLGVHIRRPDGAGPFPVVTYFHHGPGLDDGAKQSMQWIADQGYYVISHDRYYRFEPWYTLSFAAGPPDDAAREKMFSMLMGTTDEMVEADLQVVLSHVRDDAAAGDGATGCIGFCIGARSVVRSLANNPDVFAAGVGFHPSFCTTKDSDSPHLSVPSITAGMYITFGSADTMQSAADNRPFIDAVNAHEKGFAEVLDGADHGFSVPGPRYHDDAAKRAYAQAFELFERELR